MRDVIIGLLNAGVVVGTVFAAIFWARAARIKVRDSQDHFMEDLRAISEQNARGAMAACISAICVLLLMLLSAGAF